HLEKRRRHRGLGAGQTRRVEPRRESWNTDRFACGVRSRSDDFCFIPWGIDRGTLSFRMGKLATTKRSRMAALAAAGTVVLASMPTAGLALGALDLGVSMPAAGSFAALTPASVD